MIDPHELKPLSNNWDCDVRSVLSQGELAAWQRCNDLLEIVQAQAAAIAALQEKLAKAEADIFWLMGTKGL